MYRTRWFYWPILLIIDALGYLLVFPIKFLNKKQLPKNPKKILVVRLDHLGDMILTSPFFKNLKRNFPNAEIYVLCRKMCKPIAELIPGIDKILVLNPPWFSRGDSKGWFAVFKFVRKFWKHFDLVFELHTDPRNILLGRFIGKYLVGYGNRGFRFLLDKKCEWRFEYIVKQNLNLLRCLGLTVSSRDLELKINPYLTKKLFKEFNPPKRKKLVLVHPLSGTQAKNWFWSEWNKVLEALSKKDCTVLIGGSKEDAKRIAKHLVLFKNMSLVAGKYSLVEYLALIKNCNLIIAVDTFVTHATVAFKKYLLVIQSGTNSRKEWLPNLSNLFSFQGKCPKIPCGKSFCRKKICMQNLIDKIIKKIDELL